MDENALARIVVDAAFKVHCTLGPGLLESVYEAVLAYELILELKSVESTKAVHKKQLLTYLRVSGRSLGLLINFGTEMIRHGVSRVVNGLAEVQRPS